VILGTAAVLLGFVALMLVIAFMMGEPEASPAGVAKVNGNLVVYVCKGRQVGSVEIRGGSSFDGPLEWTAHKTANGEGLRGLPIRAKVPGYSIRMLGRPSDLLAVTDMTDNLGDSPLSSIIVFRPAEIPEGSIVNQHGHMQSLASWLASSDC
jgi:hypothetical protein